MHIPPIHLAIMQPAGYVHALGFLDQARYFQHQFQRLGATVTLAKNRLREDAVNYVFGAHLGFPAEWRERHACVFVNLEQLAPGGAAVNPAYLDLLAHAPVVDYDAAQVARYSTHPDDVLVVPYLHAPYLAPRPEETIALEDRPIDLLFFGSVNSRRQALIARIEALGLQVATFDHPLYCEERDAYIRQAKAILNCHFYDSGLFEQARAFTCLSLGTPVISERTAATRVPEGYEDAVFWVDDAHWEAFFARQFATPAFFDAARTKLTEFAWLDPTEFYADALAYGAGYLKGHSERRPTVPWRPTQMNLGSGKDYRPGWLNVDILDKAQPDLVLDLAAPLALPLRTNGCRGGAIALDAGQFGHIYANNVLEHVPDLPRLMTNLLALLADGGVLEVEVPYERALTAWQDPTHVRAMNEHSWLYYTEWFWYLGWFTHRFERAESGWLDAQLKPCGQAQAAFMRLVLRKVATSPRERTVARTMQADFGLEAATPEAQPA